MLRLRTASMFQVLLLLLVLTLVIVGCGNNNTGSTTPVETKVFPEKALEYVAHTNPGDGADIFARKFIQIAENNNISLGQPIYVVNKVGGSGVVAFTYVASKRGDPHYLQAAQMSLITAPLNRGAKFYWKDDFTMIANLVEDAKVLAVSANSPYYTVDDLKQAAQSKPINFGGGLAGGSDQIVGFSFAKAIGGDIEYIPFGGGGESLASLLGGDLDVISANPMEVMSPYEAGQVRLVGIVSANRNPALPDVPTLVEQGYDVTIAPNRGVAAPAGISEEARSALVKYFKDLTETDEWKEYCLEAALTPAFYGGNDFTEYMQRMEDTLVPILKEMGQI